MSSPRACRVDILNANYEPGDHRRVEALWEKPMDKDHLHRLGSGTLEFAEAHPGPENAGALVSLYNLGPCSLCRHSAVKPLLQIGCLPDWMREECRWDADEETRELVAEG